MITFIGFSHKKGVSSKTNKPYDFVECYFVKDFAEGYDSVGTYPYFYNKRCGIVCDKSFVSDYKVGDSFTDLCFNSKGFLVGGIK